jgi:hypothetical protein
MSEQEIPLRLSAGFAEAAQPLSQRLRVGSDQNDQLMPPRSQKLLTDKELDQI